MKSTLRVEMTQVKLIKSIFTHNQSYNSHDNDIISIGVSMENTSHFFDNDTKVNALQSFRTKAEHEMPFNLEVEFNAIFDLKIPVLPLEREYLTKQFLPQLIFPYMREYVAEISRRGGFPPLLINHTLFMNEDETQKNDLASLSIENSWAN